MHRVDLSDLWDAHTKYEFSAHDLEATLATMVDDAYVNHIPTMTGGYGKAALRVFYGQQFIPTIPPDFKLTSISRTIGDDQLVDEMIVAFTHTNEIPWLIPRTPPTYRYVEVPTLAVVHFRDHKLAHEHIYWDQASVLKQIGLLTDPNLPICGREAAVKLLDGSRGAR
jgi:carboxymethylenebutenolidase